MKKIKPLFTKYYFLIPVLVYVLVYAQTLGFGKAWQDDELIILPPAKDLHLMLKSFYENLPGHHFVPFYYLQGYFINLIFGENAFPFGFRLYGFFLHIISCILLSVILFKITNNKAISALISTLWTIHPLNVETLTRVGMVPFQLASGTFCLGFVYCFLKMKEIIGFKKKLIFSLLGSGFLLVSITSCEQYLFFPIVLFLIFYFLEGKKILKKKEYLYFFIIPVSLIVPIYLLWRFLASGMSMYYSGSELIPRCEPGGIKDHIFRGLWLSPQLIVHYFRLFFWPDYLAESKADWYKVGGSIWSTYSVFCQLLILGIISLAIYLYRKIPIFSIGVMWFLVSMVLVLQVVPLFTIVDEHYCYLSAIGILLMLFSFIDYWQKNISFKIVVILLVPIFSLLTWRTLLYIPSGKDSLSRSIFMAIESPDWLKPQQIAIAFQEAQLNNRESGLPAWINEKIFWEEMEKWVKKYLPIHIDLSQKFGPVQMPYNYNFYKGVFGDLYERRRFKELELLIKQSLEVKNNWYGWYRYALSLKDIGYLEEAWKAWKQAIVLRPGVNILYEAPFFEVALKANKFLEVEELLKNYRDLKPKSSHPYFSTGKFYEDFGKTEEAIGFFKEALSRDKIPSINCKSFYNYAIDFFVKNQMFDEAKQAARAILSFDPFDKTARNNLLYLEKVKS